MPELVVASVGASPIGRTDLPGRVPFPVALAESVDGLPDAADVAVGDSVERTLQEPTTPEREVAPDDETDWPAYVFGPR